MLSDIYNNLCKCFIIEQKIIDSENRRLFPVKTGKQNIFYNRVDKNYECRKRDRCAKSFVQY